MDNNLPQPLNLAFRIGTWIARPDSNELHAFTSEQTHSSEKARSLEPRLMQLLCLLAAAPQRVFTRDELMSYLWPRVIVGDNSLTRAVSELRKMLASDVDTTYIKTIPKTGYRLSPACQVVLIDVAVDGPVLPDQTAPEHSQSWQQTLPPPPHRPPMSRFLPAGAATSMVLGLLAIVLQMMPQSATRSTELALADVNLTSQAAVDALIDGKFETVATQVTLEDLIDINPDSTPPVVSRDGELFAYIHYNEQGSSLMLGSTHLPDSRVMVFTTPDTLYNLQWSPLNRALLFAQSPKFAPAALRPLDEAASLVLFDLETFTTRVLEGPDNKQREDSGLFKLTSLNRTLDWMS